VAGKIFLNYRRGDDPGFTQALYLRLESEFPAGDLFMDVEGHIKPGDDFVDVLRAQVAATDVLLVVIGPRWVDLLEARKHDSDDFVAIEIKAALDQGKRVIPVLVGGAAMPRAESMPGAIQQLARRNAVGLRPERFKADCQGLMAALKESLAAAEQERAARTATERQAAEAIRLEAEAQAAARAKAAEERGKAQAAAGLSTVEIRKAEELASWDFVKDRANVEDLRDHLARFPHGTTERYALTKLEELVWNAVKATPTTSVLKAFLDEFPRGSFASRARPILEKLESAEAAKKAKAERAQAETEAWGAAAAGTSAADLEAFLRRWPAGAHAPAARRRLREISGAGGRSRTAVYIAAALFIAVIGWLAYSSMPNQEQQTEIQPRPAPTEEVHPSPTVSANTGSARREARMEEYIGRGDLDGGKYLNTESFLKSSFDEALCKSRCVKDPQCSGFIIQEWSNKYPWAACVFYGGAVVVMNGSKRTFIKQR
jgi:hypothetical protein